MDGKFSWFTKVFGAIKEMGPLRMTEDVTFFEYNNYIFMGLVPETALLSIGSLLLYIVTTTLYFVAGSILFEKKVRL